MNTKAYTIIVFLVFNYLGFTQNTILCPLQETYLKIEDPVNVPSITNNPDGTITLTHTEAYITDVFANYVIHDFIQSFPNSSSELRKYYNISFENRDLINELYATVPSSIFQLDNNYETTPISSNIINYLDGEVFDLTKYCSDIEEAGEYCEDNEQNVPNDFYLGMEFNYDATNDLMLATIIGSTPCGNSFSISLKGGTVNNTLQLWISNPGTSTPSNYEDSCHYIEETLYGIIGVSCFEESHNGNIKINMDTGNDTLVLERHTSTFSTDFMTFTNHRLSTIDTDFEKIKLVSNYKNPYINFTNIENDNYKIEIFNVSGKQILKNKTFNNNSILSESFATGLYFIKLQNNKKSRVFKFIKN
ncbi:T9SS type A sorting domain-containing protein [Lacinutrix himadriensis]|uniref:T9SS type A sorting domain-containing protein n=1 Tax=Lacinutrix himadriensis TaxID=641549 RepID=UPI0006E2FB63|nr:T9SS type A sorting domain-containing protein [Lacinutrix himadriensis]